MKPMLAKPAPKDVGLDAYEGWVCDLKLDGLRAVITWDGTSLAITNRNEVDITRKFPEVYAEIIRQIHNQGPLVLDGEIMAKDGLFSTVATRGKQSDGLAAAAAAANPATFVAFDLLFVEGQDVRARTLSERRALLANVLSSPSIVISSTKASLMWESVLKLGLEGMIVKHPNSPYRDGTRSPSWLKIKTVQRITCIATGYEPGNGARKDFGAMTLVLLDGTTPLEVGRVGSGFTHAEIKILKASLDAGQPVLVDIECLNRTARNQLRFPVYKGIRSDLPLTAASKSQLLALPIC